MHHFQVPRNSEPDDVEMANMLFTLHHLPYECRDKGIYLAPYRSQR